MQKFQLKAPFEPAGDQPQAIRAAGGGSAQRAARAGADGRHRLGQDVHDGERHSGSCSGRRWCCRTTRRWRPSSTSEFKEFFPHNAVSYFVSYYDYYQPEAYIPQRDIYIEKDASINEEIDRLRLATTSSLVSRRDVIVVASVSCIYGLGSPEDYKAMMVGVSVGDVLDRDAMLAKLVDIQYERNDTDPSRGKFRVRGDSVEVWPSYEEFAYRIEFWGDEVERLSIINPTSGEVIDKLEQVYIYPAKHFVLPEERIHNAVDEIRKELRERLELFKSQGKLLEAQRLSARTRYDIEMMMEMGYCPGIENYSRPLSGRKPGEPPYTLFDFFPEGLSAVRRRVARHGAAGGRDVQRRPQPQGDARRARLPAAECARQPAAEVRRVAASGSTRWSMCRRRRGRTSWSRRAAKWSSRSCGRPGCWIR